MKNSKEWKKWLFWFTFAVAAISVYKLLDNFTEIVASVSNFFSLLKPFLFASVLAYLLYIPCKKVEETYFDSKIKILKKHRRGLSVFTMYAILLIVIFIITNFVFPAASKSITDLANNIPDYYTKAIEYFENAEEGSIAEKIASTDFANDFKSMNIGNLVKEYLSFERVTEYAKGIIGATSVIFDVFVTIVVSIYLLLERRDIKSFLKNVCKAIMSEEGYKKVSKYYNKTNLIFYNYLASQIIDAFVVGIITSVAMAIMKVKYAVVLGFMIGLFNLIPYFGAIIGVAVAIIITIFTGGFEKAILLAVVVIILQQIDANIINPKILGSSLQLSPILVIFGVTIGGAYFGVLGMFLGVPVVALIKIILIDGIDERNHEKQEQSSVLTQENKKNE